MAISADACCMVGRAFFVSNTAVLCRAMHFAVERAMHFDVELGFLCRTSVVIRIYPTNFYSI